ncbi:c-Myc-binding protein-like isoform X1 [Schistocerca cancellata]|uniref:c-Myc-binding protein-like isoform X1 n=1 Tax=Schistocerca cancellata TaxID=274614 RepID=UPI002118331F|nr:c-Myc-binding protein-like isoform X1 [Schistocerca cancellata]
MMKRKKKNVQVTISRDFKEIMSDYRPIDAKREEFRKYLEGAGVLDALTKVFISLYEAPEKPTDPLEFVRCNIGDNVPDMAEYEAVQAELARNSDAIEKLRAENEALRARIAELEPVTEGGEEGAAPEEGAEQTEGGEEPPAEGEGEEPPPPEEQPAE